MIKPILSPSQIRQWRTCPRKWAWRYVAGIRTESGGGAKLGSRCHEILEAWLRHGKVPDESEVLRYMSVFGNPVERWPGLIVSAALHHFPLRTPTLQVEREVRFETAAAWWITKTDSQDGPRIDDLKTVSRLQDALHDDPTKPGFLGDDPQALLYSAASGHAETDLHWNYVQTAPRSGRYPTRKVRLQVLARGDRTVRGLDAIERSAELMAEVKRRDVHPLELPPNPLACEQYGGCEHKERCALSMRDRWRYTMAERAAPDNRDPAIAALLAGMGSPDNPGPRFEDEPPPLPEEEPPPLPVEDEPPPLPEEEPYQVNPPESPPDSGEPRPIMGLSDGPFDPEAATRDELKAYALARGWVEKSCAWKRDRLLALVLERMPVPAAARTDEALPLEPIILAGDHPVQTTIPFASESMLAPLERQIADESRMREEMDRELTTVKRQASVALAMVRALFQAYGAKPEVQAALLQRAGLRAEDLEG